MTGKLGIISQIDTFTATGVNSAGNSWSYFGEALINDPTQIRVTVKKTRLYDVKISLD